MSIVDAYILADSYRETSYSFHMVEEMDYKYYDYFV